jgi:hypothetical protein
LGLPQDVPLVSVPKESKATPGFGFQVSGFGLRVLVSRIRVSGFGFRVLGFSVSSFGFRMAVRTWAESSEGRAASTSRVT